MDHLASVSGVPYNPIVVPYLGGTYHEFDFLSWPLAETAIDIEALRDKSIPIAQLRSAAPDLQAWFFFGMLQGVFNVPISPDDFITVQGDGRRVITTEMLPDYIDIWKTFIDEQYSDPENGDIAEERKRIVRCLLISNEFWKSFHCFSALVGNAVELSIQILGCTLENAALRVLKIPVEFLPWHRTGNTALFQRMKNDGWCPALLSQIAYPDRLPWLYYISLLGPPKNNRHKLDATCKFADRSCQIKLAQTSDTDYTPKHVCEDGSCPHLTPMASIYAVGDSRRKMDDIASIIRDGGIPLLEFDKSTTTIQVTRYGEGVHYTAISHVWTDGMGNPKSNSMPRCQVERMCESMASIPWTNKVNAATMDSDLVWQKGFEEIEISADEVQNKSRKLLFWIDTICVPQEDELRNIAIAGMRSVYNRANRVLVYDAELTCIKGDLSMEEILTRISISNWVRRFWTLQEAILAKALWFQFGEKCYQPMSMNDRSTDERYKNIVANFCQDFNFEWRAIARGVPYTLRVAMVWTELGTRSSRYAEDQPICVATLLDMDVSKIAKAKPQDRIKALWASYEMLPTGVIFAPGARLLQAPYRWAPAEMTGLVGLPPPTCSTSAIPTSEGLKVTHHGLITTKRLTANREGVIGFQTDNDVYFIRQQLKKDNPPWTGHLPSQTPKIELTKYDLIGVVISQDSFQTEEEREPFAMALGALVGISLTPSNSVDEGIIRCEYLRTVSIYQKDSLYYQHQEWTIHDEIEKNMLIPARFTPVQQKWLIS